MLDYVTATWKDIYTEERFLATPRHSSFRDKTSASFDINLMSLAENATMSLTSPFKERFNLIASSDRDGR